MSIVFVEGTRVVKASVRRVVIEVPDELEVRLRVELAMRLYEKSIASLGQTRRIASLLKWDFLELLAMEGIPVHYGEEDLKVAKKLAGRAKRE